MDDYCVLDRLPVELLHTLFDYFSASKLLFTFHKLSDYINATLQSYSSYQLDFQSLSKSAFRRICCHIQPEQVISLVLSDRDDTPGLSETFFSRFRIEQFIRLRSLTLIAIEFNSLKFIFTNLSQLHELRSFSFDAYSIRHTYGHMDLDCYQTISQIKSMLHDAFTYIFPRLYFLSLNSSSMLDAIPLPNLRHLKLDNYPATKFKMINDIAPKLRSLDVHIQYEQTGLEVSTLSSRLTRLQLKIDDFRISMSNMKWMLENCTCLKHLELHLQGHPNLADGEQWSSLTRSVITFNFKFDMKIDDIEGTLRSFRTPFWLEEKRWFVAYQDECLFSIPYFAPVEVSTSYQPPIHFTSSNDDIFWNNVTKITMDEHPIVRIDLSNLKWLSILSLDDLLQFAHIERQMVQLSHLSIKNEITKKQLQRMVVNPCEQIRTLEIENNLNGEDCSIIEGLYRLFPYTERFIYKPDIQSIGFMARIVDRFARLSSASFQSLGPLHSQNIQYRYNPDLMLLRTKRPSYGTSICRIYYLPNNRSSFGIHWWIEE